MLREALPIIAFKQKKNSSSISIKKNELGSQGRFFTESHGMLIYSSSGGAKKKLNGSVLDQFGKKILCRHLSGNILNSIRADGRVMKDYHDIYSSLAKIAAVPYLKENHYDNNRIAYNAAYYNIFALNTLGVALSKVAEVLKVGEESSLLFDSENHTMAFTVIRKKAVDGDHYIIKFYDPNETDNHTRVLCNSLDDMKNLSINDLLDHSSVNRYFQSHKHVALFSPKQRLKDERPLVDLSGFNFGAQLLYCMWFGLSNVIQSLVKRYLANGGAISFPTTSKGNCLLSLAKKLNHSDAVNEFINAINQSDLSPNEKARILKNTTPIVMSGNNDGAQQLSEFNHVNLNDQNVVKDTPLLWAIFKNNELISLYLIERTDITVRDFVQKNALDYALELKNFNVTFHLLKKGLSLDDTQQCELLRKIDNGSHRSVCDYIASRYKNITDNDPSKFERLMRLLKDVGKDDIVKNTIQKMNRKKDKITILIKMEFDEHLNNFKHKAKEMSDKAEYDFNYVKAGVKANKFCLALEEAKQRFLNNQDDSIENAKNQLKADCNRAVKDVRTELHKHREWIGALLKFCIDVLSFITIGLTDSKLGLFAKTASSIMLDRFVQDFNEEPSAIICTQ